MGLKSYYIYLRAYPRYTAANYDEQAVALYRRLTIRTRVGILILATLL